MGDSAALPVQPDAPNSQKEFSRQQSLTFEQQREEFVSQMWGKYGFCKDNVRYVVDTEHQSARRLGYDDAESARRAIIGAVNHYTRLVDTEMKLRLINTPVAEAITAQELLCSDEPEPGWLVEGIIKEGGIVIFAGDPASFKSFFALFIAVVAGSAGGDLYGEG